MSQHYQCREGWLQPAKRCLSPHQDERPPNMPVDAVIIHAISLPPGRFGTPHIDQLFSGTLDTKADPFFQELAGLRVSAHLLISRDASITQYVNFNKRAWHAGQSQLQGREKCNDFSIGIELEGEDSVSFTEAQYQGLFAVLSAILAVYPIPIERIVGHSDVAPGRKTDPGPCFDWGRVREALKEKACLHLSY